jgi:uncharacterized protein
MKIAVVSDTHDHMREMAKVIDYLNANNCELLLHCGDWDMPFAMRSVAHAKFPIKSVLGNGDPDILKFLYQLEHILELKDLQISFNERMHDITVDGKRICVFHGNDTDLYNLIVESQLFDVFCTGHDHVASITRKEKTLIINPGSFCGWKYGIGEEPRYIVEYETTSDTARLIDIDKEILQG